MTLFFYQGRPICNPLYLAAGKYILTVLVDGIFPLRCMMKWEADRIACFGAEIGDASLNPFVFLYLPGILTPNKMVLSRTLEDLPCLSKKEQTEITENPKTCYFTVFCFVSIVSQAGWI